MGVFNTRSLMVNLDMPLPNHVTSPDLLTPSMKV